MIVVFLIFLQLLLFCACAIPKTGPARPLSTAMSLARETSFLGPVLGLVVLSRVMVMC